MIDWLGVLEFLALTGTPFVLLGVLVCALRKEHHIGYCAVTLAALCAFNGPHVVYAVKSAQFCYSIRDYRVPDVYAKYGVDGKCWVVPEGRPWLALDPVQILANHKE